MRTHMNIKKLWHRNIYEKCRNLLRPINSRFKRNVGLASSEVDNLHGQIDDYVRMWWSSIHPECTYNDTHLAIDYCNPSLMDRILDTIATIKYELTVKESQTENI